MRHSGWNENTVLAMCWTRQILAARGLAEPPPESIWRMVNSQDSRLVKALTSHRLASAAWSTLDDNPSLLTNSETRSIIRQLAAPSRIRCLRTASVATQIDSILRDRGTPALFIKGVFQSQQCTGNFWFRGSGDLDVVVPGHAFQDAVERLTMHGGVVREGPKRTRIGAKVAEVHHATTIDFQGVTVDLHSRLDPAHLMKVSFPEIWHRREVVMVAGQELPTLSRLDSCVFVASHGCQDNWATLRQVMDFVLAWDAALDSELPELVFETALAQGVARRLQVAIEVARVVCPALPPQSQRARMMSNWAWSRHRSGRLTRGSGRPLDAMGTFAFWMASEGHVTSYSYGLKRLAWLPSMAERSPMPERLWWLTPALSPYLLLRRLLERAQLVDEARVHNTPGQ